MRLGACLDVGLHIIMPCGFILDDKRISRSVMGYKLSADLVLHESYAAFREKMQGRRVIAVTPRRGMAYTDFYFRDGDTLLFGKESVGLSEEAIKDADAVVYIPMRNGMDSLNLAISAAIVASEAMRQLNFFKPLIQL